MIVSPRVARFSKTWTDEEMDRIIAIHPRPISLAGLNADLDSELLNQALRGFFHPDAQIREILRTLVSVAGAHAESHFPSDSKFLQGLYSPNPWGKSKSPAICLTGLGGVGKTDLLFALALLLGEESRIDLAGHTGLPLVALWHLSTHEGPGLADLLRPYVDTASDSASANSETSIARTQQRRRARNIVDLAKRRSWRDSVCLLLIDELQFMAHGSEAYAAILAFLLRVLEIGPRTVFCANFSLLHKLKRRNQEHQDRFLARPIILHPLARDSAGWVSYLAAAKSVAPEVLVFDPASDAAEIHRYTHGIKRAFVDLATIALRLARLRSRHATVGTKELLAAYRSLEYTAHRTTVETLQEQAIVGRMIREDLWCPLVSLDPAPPSGSSNTIATATHAIAAFEQRVNDGLLDASLTPAEAAAAEAIESQPRRGRKPGVVVPLRGKKATKADLLVGADVLESL